MHLMGVLLVTACSGEKNKDAALEYVVAKRSGDSDSWTGTIRLSTLPNWNNKAITLTRKAL